jgi:hypothetical protein
MSKWRWKKEKSLAVFQLYKTHRIPLNLYVEGLLTYFEYYYLTINQIKKGTYGKTKDVHNFMAGRVNMEKIKRAG